MKRINENPPHIFAIAEATIGSLKSQKQNQAVIISGESGAGKSESTKLILQYLTAVTSNASQESWVEQQILEANTVLESFGNGKTVRNNNSSRFGKFIQVLFNRNSQIIGASIVNYLLEKSRVAVQSPSERNYHVFYELVQGVNDEEKTKYNIADPDAYNYLNQSGCIDIPGVSDKKNFEKLKLALTVLNMAVGDMESLFKTLSAILWMGNVKFVDNGNDSVKVENPEVVEKVSALVAVDNTRLSEALVNKKLTIRGEVTLVPLKYTQAHDNRDSIAKAIYDNLFQRIVEFINTSLTAKEKSTNFIGVLDIFGFEAFETNSFEQFCINYTNEKLQQFFNQFIFKLEQEETKPSGVLSLLDEETKFPKGTDDSWLQKMDQALGKHAYYIKPRTAKGLFGIKHYAGEVMYTVAGFLDKNKDAIAEEIYDLFQKSSNKFVSKIFATKEADSAGSSASKGGPPPKGGKPGGAGGKTTAGTNFKNQLTALVTTLASTAPHYVRCIKPNPEKEAFSFNEDMVLAQLRYSGMLDTIRIRKAGYPMRVPFQTFAKNFKCLVPSGMTLGKDPADKIVMGIATDAKLPPNAWQCGKTKIFMRDEAMTAIQAKADEILKVKVLLIQRVMHGYIYRVRYRKIRSSALFLQKYIKMFVYRRRFVRICKAVVKIQAVIRGWFARDYYRTLKGEQERKAQPGAAAEIEAVPTKPVHVEQASLVPVIPELDLLKEVEEKVTKEEGAVEDMFSFLGEFDPSKRKAQFKGSDALVRMALNLTSEIDALFNDIPAPAAPKQGQQLAMEAAKSGSREELRGGVEKVEKVEGGVGEKSKEEEEGQVKPKQMKSNPLLKKDLVAILDEEIINYNSAECSMQTYAERYFETQVQKAGTLSKLTQKIKTVDVDDLLRYTKKTPIGPSVLFKVLEPNVRKGEDPFQALHEIIAIGIEMPELRDEILVQMCKQVTTPKDVPKTWDTILFNGWHALMIAAATLPASKFFSKFFQAFIERTIEQYKKMEGSPIKKMAVMTADFMRRARLHGPRKRPPSLAEFQALKNGAAMSCQFHFLDGNIKVIEINPTTTGMEILKELARHSGLREQTGWSLFELEGSTERLIKASDYIADVLSAWESANKGQPQSQAAQPSTGLFGKKKEVAVAASSPVSVNFTERKELKIIFKRRIFRNPLDDALDHNELNMLYAQAADEIMRDWHPMTDEQAMELGGIRAYVHFGDEDKKIVGQQFVRELESWIPARLVPNQPKEVWVSGLLDKYIKMQGTTPDQAKGLFMEGVRKFSSYGATMFNVRYRGYWSHPESIILAVSHKGVDYIHKKQRQTIMFIPYANIKEYTSENGDTLSITVKVVKTEEGDVDETDQVEVYSFASPQADEIIALIREYCPAQASAKHKDTNLFDIGALRRDVQKAKSALLESGIMRRPGPSSDAKTRRTSSASKKLKVPVTQPSRTRSNSSNSRDSSMPSTLIRSISSTAKDSSFSKSRSSVTSMTSTNATAVSQSESMSQVKESETDEFGSMVSLDKSASAESGAEEYTEADWAFSRARITAPLMMLNGPSELEDWAVTTFMTIQNILSRCIEVPGLVNELYLQLIKCTTDHPEEDSQQVLSFWKFMAICVGVIAPTGEVLEYLKSHLRNVVDARSRKPRREESTHAKFCYKTLQKTLASSTSRKFPPSCDEIMFATKLSPLRVRVYFLDGQFRAIPLEPSAPAKEVFALLLEKTKMKGTTGFSLFEVFGTHERAVSDDEKLSDLLFKWEYQAKETNSKEKVQFIFKKRLFLNARVPCKTDMEESLMRAQALEDMKKDMFPLEVEQAIYVTAAMAQVLYGDSMGRKGINYMELASKVLPKRISSRQDVDLEVEARHASLRGKTIEEANTLLMDVMRSWPLYGSTIFDVEQTYTNEIPVECWLAVNIEGVHILARHKREPLVTYQFAKIVSYVPSPKSILLLTDSLTNGTKYVFNTPHGADIATLIKDYIANAARSGS
ncbi:cytochrome c oxidase subunit 1 [Quaeritorhiza haematococci]|nr:cytochrome c oxidase subunit 1 [Quaeritorhiza haematococci]